MKHDTAILFAANPAEALALVKVIGFSVALVDLDLPDQNGFELIQQIHAALPSLPKPVGPAWQTTIERIRTPEQKRPALSTDPALRSKFKKA